MENFKTTGLSLLVNNAGVGWGSNTPYLKTKNDLEEIVGVNHFGHFLLILLPNLKQPESARVVIVSSSLHDLEARKKQKDDDNNNEPKMVLPNF